MIFRAFFDESGTSPHENKSLVMGGFVGHIDEWKQASEAWDECLQESPSINHFSRNEANMLDGQFRHWKRSAADEKVKNLAGVINFACKVSARVCSTLGLRTETRKHPKE